MSKPIKKIKYSKIDFDKICGLAYQGTIDKNAIIHQAYFDNEVNNGKYTYLFQLGDKYYTLSVATKPHGNQGYISKYLLKNIKFLITLKKKDFLILVKN